MKVFALGFLLITVGGVLPAEQADGSFDRSFAISGAVDLDAKTDSGGISIHAGPSGAVHVHAILKAQHGWFDSGSSGDVEARVRELEQHPPVEQNGNQVRVGYVNDARLLRGISMHLEIETPSDTGVRARAGSGGIRISGTRGLLDCKTDSGGIQIQDVGSDVHAEADSGRIHIGNVKGSVFARADSGGIEATDVTGKLDVQSDSGHIHLSQTSPAAIRAKADSGGVTVTLAPGAGYDISAEAGSGRISTPEVVADNSFSRHHIEGKIRGGGPLVSIRAGSGSITIE